MSDDLALVLEACVRGKLNILVSGGTATGKTTMLNVLSRFIPEHERIITVEDAAELQLQQPHVVTLEARPANTEGQGQVTIRDLVRNTLRMRPDRIVVGECRGGEALDMLQAMNTGHEGSLTTLHANSARDALQRLEMLVLMAGVDLPERAIREMISSAIDLVIQITRLPDGSRKVTSVQEIHGMEDRTIVLQELFSYEPKLDDRGKYAGVCQPTGLRPRFVDKLKQHGVELPAAVVPQVRWRHRARPHRGASDDGGARRARRRGRAWRSWSSDCSAAPAARQDEILQYLELPFAEEDVDPDELVERVGLLAPTAGAVDDVLQRLDLVDRIGAKLEKARMPLRPGEYVLLAAGQPLAIGMWIVAVRRDRGGPA